MASSSRRTDPAGAGATGGGAVGSPSRRPKPTGRRSVTVTAVRSGLRGLGTGADPTRLELRRRRADRAEALEASEQLPFLVVQPVLDVEREHVSATRGPDAERDRDRVLR